MLIQYLIFCLGAGLVQGAYARQPGPGGVSTFDAPLWFFTPAGKIIIPIIAIGLFIAEVILGFVLVAWWAGVFLWLPALLIASIFVPGSAIVSRNPAVPFFIGILIVIGATISFLV
ncbi:MAG: hypothetical protein PHG83_04430 [Patescibacteria group bacterium]|nr:hypothetical protein [Patescibacteria group bacterium]